ncbi:MAG: hypothetical protein HC853_01310, partial [Anaerolineae bacterium]|nr:hypothetical protein [Anaerolineae bacterium]
MSRENPSLSFTLPIAIVKGAGDLGTGIAFRLHKAGFRVLCTDLEKPLVIRRMVAFASAIYNGRISVEGVVAARINFADEAVYLWQRDTIPVMPTRQAAPSKRLDHLAHRLAEEIGTSTTIAEAMRVLRMFKADAALFLALADIGGYFADVDVTKGIAFSADVAVQQSL